jgi:hypothetical protein
LTAAGWHSLAAWRDMRITVDQLLVLNAALE